EHPETLGAMIYLASLYEAQGWYERAEPLYRRALEASRRVHGQNHINTIIVMNNLVFLCLERRELAEAESLSRQALELGQSKLDRRHPVVTNLMALLGQSLLRQGKYAEAEPALRESLASREEVEPDNWVRFGSRSLLGASLLGQGRYAEA